MYKKKIDKKKMMKQYNIYCDGGSRNNPGPSSSAFIGYDASGVEVFRYGKFLGKQTNNVAEYKAIILALSWLFDKGDIICNINFYLDSLLVVNQMKSRYQIKNGVLYLLSIKIRNLERMFRGSITYNYVPREKNKEADLLVNKTTDDFYDSLTPS